MKTYHLTLGLVIATLTASAADLPHAFVRPPTRNVRRMISPIAPHHPPIIRPPLTLNSNSPAEVRLATV